MDTEKPKDRDFVETVEGLIFCVVGYLHPPDRYTAYLKYVPDPGGRWRREGTKFARVLPYYHVSQVEGTYGLLRERYPRYLYSCPVMNITVSSVPRDSVKTYYRPRERLRSIITGGPKDELERKLADLTAHLCEISGLSDHDLGVTGSILIRSHSPEFSDIDLTVYGREASTKLKRAIRESRGADNKIQPFNDEKKEEWSRSRAERFPLDFEELMGFAERRWNYGIYGGTYFSVHPVRTDEEITENYGDFTYEREGMIKGEAVIADSSESIYLPAIYRLEEASTDRRVDDKLTEVASYEGLYCDMFKRGERVGFRGVLERVRDGEERFRVVVGGAGSRTDYMRSLS
jgi:hypothetical protein